MENIDLIDVNSFLDIYKNNDYVNIGKYIAIIKEYSAQGNSNGALIMILYIIESIEKLQNCPDKEYLLEKLIKEKTEIIKSIKYNKIKNGIIEIPVKYDSIEQEKKEKEEIMLRKHEKKVLRISESIKQYLIGDIDSDDYEVLTKSLLPLFLNEIIRFKSNSIRANQYVVFYMRLYFEYQSRIDIKTNKYGGNLINSLNIITDNKAIELYCELESLLEIHNGLNPKGNLGSVLNGLQSYINAEGKLKEFEKKYGKSFPSVDEIKRDQYNLINSILEKKTIPLLFCFNNE